MFTQVAVLWTGLSLSGQAVSLAGLGGAWTFAAAVMDLVSGPIVDRFNRRSLLIWLHVCLAALSIALFAVARTGHLRMWHLWAYLIGQAVFGGPAGMAFSTILPDLVQKSRLVRINGTLQSWGMGDNLIEAAVSGVVLGVWGPAPIFLFNGVMCLFASAGAMFVPKDAGVARSSVQENGWHPISDLKLTFRYVVREPLLRRTIPLGIVNSMIFGCLFFMPPLVSTALGAGSEGYGFLQSLTLGGVLAGSLLAASIGTKWPKLKVWVGGTALYGIGFLALGIFLHWGFALTALVAYLAFFLFGLGCTGGRVYYASLYQQMLPSAHRGRVFGIAGFLGSSFQPLALALAMLLVDRSGVGLVLIGLAALTLVLSVARVSLLPMQEEAWVLSEPPDCATVHGGG
jgi:MFS family permease